MKIKRNYDEVIKVDRDIRRLFPVVGFPPTPQDKVIATIEVIGGFELFNTYPYHNYETWSQGYRITSRGITVESEYLDDALELWEQKSISKSPSGVEE